MAAALMLAGVGGLASVGTSGGAAAQPNPAAAPTTPAPTVPAPVLSWSAPRPAASPPALEYAAAAYDGDTHSLVLYGGIMAAGGLSGNTWVWNGATWTEYPPSPGMAAREMASMAFDPVRHQLIVFGGQGPGGGLLGDTWAWNGLSWAAEPENGPAPREAASLAYDAQGDLVLFGGTGYAGKQQGNGRGPQVVLGDTWQWTGSAWVRSPASGPPTRSGAALAYDSTADTTVLFSGTQSPVNADNPQPLADTWLWNGSAWSQQNGATAPPPRYAAVFADDPAVGGPVLMAGAGSSGPLADGWLWSPSGWIAATTTGTSTATVGAAGGFDPAGAAFVLFGGIGAGGVGLSGTQLVTASVPTVTTPGSTPGTTGTTSPTSDPGGATSATTTPPPASTGPASTPRTTASQPAGSVAGAKPPAQVRPATLSVDTGTHVVRRGSTVHLSGSGFRPGALVTVTFHSTPAVLGQFVASNQGTLAATVGIPDSASPGEHHLIATGPAPSGGTTELIAAVEISGPAHPHGRTAAMTFVMVALAVSIPAAAWLSMSGAGWWRRRRSPAA